MKISAKQMAVLKSMAAGTRLSWMNGLDPHAYMSNLKDHALELPVSTSTAMTMADKGLIEMNADTRKVYGFDYKLTEAGRKAIEGKP